MLAVHLPILGHVNEYGIIVIDIQPSTVED